MTRAWRSSVLWLVGVIAVILVVGLAAVVLLVRPEPATVAACSPDVVRRAVDAVSEDRIRASLQHLTTSEGDSADEDVSRHVDSPGNAEAVEWIRSTLAATGASTQNQAFRSDGRSLANVVATIPGANDGARYGVGAHLDSISEEGRVAPGADDNASGVVAVLEAARVIGAMPRSCLTASIDFVAFNDEEEQMKGSAEYAESVRRSMRGFVNLDMIGSGDEPCVHATYNKRRDEPMAAEFVGANKRLDLGLQVTSRRYTEDDQDAASFWEQELPVTYVYECSLSPHYHSSSDEAQYLNVHQIALTTKATVAALLNLAGSP